jgi:hypothetical protein
VDPLAWLALVMAAPPTLLLVLAAVAMGRSRLEQLAPAQTSLKATLISTSGPAAALPAVLCLTAAAAVALGFGALWRGRRAPSPPGTRVAMMAIILGLLAFPVAVALGLVAGV